MPWLANVDAVLEAWYPGEQAGASIAGVLFGDSGTKSFAQMTATTQRTSGIQNNQWKSR